MGDEPAIQVRFAHTVVDSFLFRRLRTSPLNMCRSALLRGWSVLIRDG
jgi:hypothetical protein